MATNPMFDTLRFSRKLRDAGFSPQQAEGLAEAVSEGATDQLVTKQDLRYDLSKLELTLTIRMGVIAAALAAANHYWK